MIIWRGDRVKSCFFFYPNMFKNQHDRDVSLCPSPYKYMGIKKKIYPFDNLSNYRPGPIQKVVLAHFVSTSCSGSSIYTAQKLPVPGPSIYTTPKRCRLPWMLLLAIDYIISYFGTCINRAWNNKFKF